MVYISTSLYVGVVIAKAIREFTVLSFVSITLSTVSNYDGSLSVFCQDKHQADAAAVRAARYMCVCIIVGRLQLVVQ